MDVKFIQLLEQRLSKELPGEDFQNLMAPAASEKYRILRPDHKVACVLLLIFPREKEWYISFIERTSQHPEDKHGGQLGFPGGKLDPSDSSYEDCALRETYEELGVPPDSVGILGSLTPLYVYVSNFLVHPYVGFTTEYPKFILQESEVKSVLEVPVTRFVKSKYKSIADIEVRDIILKDTPYYDIYGQKLWGATAMMISEFEKILIDICD